MKKTLLAACILVATAGIASAGGSPGTIGVGGEFLATSVDLGGGSSQAIGGPSVNYDAGAFHVGGAVLLVDPAGEDNTSIGVAGRFYYHAHSSALADFGVGGTVAFVNTDDPDPMEDSSTYVFIQPGIQIRAFIATNVALSFGAGFTIGAKDADGVAMTSGPSGSAGFHYYFF